MDSYKYDPTDNDPYRTAMGYIEERLLEECGTARVLDEILDSIRYVVAEGEDGYLLERIYRDLIKSEGLDEDDDVRRALRTIAGDVEEDAIIVDDVLRVFDKPAHRGCRKE